MAIGVAKALFKVETFIRTCCLQHWSSRKGNSDRCKSLWCGWAVMGAAQRFWFAGDTGYCGVFKEIGQKYGPFDLSAIPIGAYTPQWMLKAQHVNPSEAVQIHQVGKKSMCLQLWVCAWAGCLCQASVQMCQTVSASFVCLVCSLTMYCSTV